MSSLLYLGSKPWSCLVKVLSDKDGDDEVTCYCLTLINKVRLLIVEVGNMNLHF